MNRFDTESFSDFSAKSSNFRRLVLGCMDSYDSESRRIFQHFSRSTVAPIGAKKKCKHFSSPRKKGTFGGLGGAQGARWLPATEMGLTSGQPWVNVRSTFGQRSVNLRSTLGIFPSHLGPIMGIFIGCFNQTRKILLTYFSNG